MVPQYQNVEGLCFESCQCGGVGGGGSEEDVIKKNQIEEWRYKINPSLASLSERKQM